MKFSKYFDSWLNHNYYKKGVCVGKKGDFYTAVSVGELFGHLLANHLLQIIAQKRLIPPFSVVEIGANEGFLMKDLYTFLPASIRQNLDFFIVEPHTALQKLQAKNLRGLNITFKQSLDELEVKSAFIFANELFDCFPPELIDNNKLCFVENNKLVFKECEDEIFTQAAKCSLKRAEISPALLPFLQKLKKTASNNLIFSTFDYFSLGDLDEFSLRIFKDHQLYDPFKEDLSKFYKNSDITYNVNLIHFKQCLNELNFTIFEDKKQSLAFIDFGLHEVVDKAKDTNKMLIQAKNLMFGFTPNFRYLEFGY